MAKELELKYGCNPNQKPARIFMQQGELPLEVLNGRPGYINFLDALNSWQLVRELKEATGLAAAASFKHVSPAGAAVGLPLSDTLRKIYFVDDVDFPLTPIATAYARARGADRMSSYGDFVALSETCDEATARLLSREVSDGVIAPDYTPEALEVLRKKRKGTYNVIKIDPSYRPAPVEHKDVYGVTFEQGRNEVKLDESLLQNLPRTAETALAPVFKDISRQKRRGALTPAGPQRAVPAVAPLQQQRAFRSAVRRRRVRDLHHARAALQVLRTRARGRLARRRKRRLRREGGSPAGSVPGRRPRG